MSDCGCDQAKRDLEEFLHHELPAKDSADIEEHIEGCAECSDEVKVGIALTAIMQRACSETAPEELKAMVALRIHELSASR